MQPIKRENIIEKFSTFINWNWEEKQKKQVISWRKDTKLRLNIQNLFNNDKDSSPIYWGLFFHDQWKKETNDMAKQHLYAYLQESCYQIAVRFYYMYRNKFSSYSIEDFFQIGISKIEAILGKFSRERYNNLEAFATTCFRNKILDELRQQTKILGRNRWSLILRCSETRLRKALKDSERINDYLLVWDCFKEVYSMNDSETSNRSEPTDEIWEEIAQIYNSNFSLKTNKINSETARKWLNICMNALENLPKFISLDQSINNENDSTFEEILSLDQIDEIEKLMETEEQEQINSILFESIKIMYQESKNNSTKSLKIQQMLRCADLSYCQNQTQLDIAQQIGKSQNSFVSRQLSTFRKELLTKLSEELQKLHKSVDSTVIKNSDELMKEWLKEHFCDCINTNFDNENPDSNTK